MVMSPLQGRCVDSPLYVGASPYARLFDPYRGVWWDCPTNVGPRPYAMLFDPFGVMNTQMYVGVVQCPVRAKYISVGVHPYE